MTNKYKKDLKTIEITIKEEELSKLSGLSLIKIAKLVNSKVAEEEDKMNDCISTHFTLKNIDSIAQKYNKTESTTNELLQAIIVHYRARAKDLIIQYIPKEEEVLIPQTINSADEIIQLFNKNNYFDFCKIVESNITNKNSAKTTALELYSLLKCYSGYTEECQILLEDHAILELKNDQQFKKFCSQFNYAKQDINQIDAKNESIIQEQPIYPLPASNEIMTGDQQAKAQEYIKQLIGIYKSNSSPQDIKDAIKTQIQYRHNPHYPIMICHHLTDFYSEAKNIIPSIAQDQLIKDYKFLTLLDKDSQKKLIKKIESVDDIFDLFNHFELSEVGIKRHIPVLIKGWEACGKYITHQQDAFIDTIASLSDHKDKEANAEQLYKVLDGFASNNQGLISDDNKQMLKSSPTWTEWLCSWLPESVVQKIQDYTTFKPKTHQEIYKIKQLAKNLDKLLNHDKAKSF